MPQLQPEVLAEHSQAGLLRLQLRIPAELEHFKGHFEGMPILPGVVQVDWAIQFALHHFGIKAQFSALDNLKFQSPVRPNMELSLEMNWHQERSRLEFVYSAGAHKYSSGRVLFNGEPS